MWAGAERSTANRSGVNVVEVVARNEFHRLWNVSGFVGGRRWVAGSVFPAVSKDRGSSFKFNPQQNKLTIFFWYRYLEK